MASWKSKLIGDYEWRFLCMPRKFWASNKSVAPPFFGRDEPISIFVAAVMGLQHSLAMVGGIITVPLIISGSFYGNFSQDEAQYIISAALIVSGLASLVQVLRFRIPFTPYFLGTGLLSVMGISFTFLPIAQSSIQNMRACSCGGSSCVVGGSCNTCPGPLSGDCNTGQEAYGRFLGTLLVCCFIEVAFSFLPAKALRATFPPVVTGTVVILIGANLLGTGFSYWGGGVYCAENVSTTHPTCSNNGETNLNFGNWRYVGLGFVVFFTLIVVEIFGSPFMRNIQVVIGLLVGMIVAASTHVTTCDKEGNCEKLLYVTDKVIKSAKWGEFLWVHTFPIGFYAPAVLPCLLGFLVTTMECIGDVTATRETSNLPVSGDEFDQNIQGGVLADGLNSFFGALATMMPVTTFAQNNGVIALTRCASRRAGIGCACWLILFGIIGKFSAIILTIPDCVLGGMTTFLFVNVLVSGIKILTMGHGLTRRTRFIAAMSLAVGLGVTIVPQFVNVSNDEVNFPNQGPLWPTRESWSPGFRGFRDAIIIVLSTGFSIGGFLCIILNFVIPYGEEDLVEHTGYTEEEYKPQELENGIAPKSMEMHKGAV